MAILTYAECLRNAGLAVPPLIPLEDIPDGYVADPIQGLRELERYYPPGWTITSKRLGPQHVIATIIRGPAAVMCELMCELPAESNQTMAVYDRQKFDAYRLWLTRLAEHTARINGLPFDLYKRQEATTIKAALASARPAPNDTCDKASSYQAPVDAFVARVIARRSLAHEPSS